MYGKHDIPDQQVKKVEGNFYVFTYICLPHNLEENTYKV